MSVSALAGILRRLRRDLAEKATFRTGTVIEMIDTTHVLVDIGKPVPAFVSPIFLPAVVVGAPVVVQIQGSHYDVVNAPESDARLVTTAELDAIRARLAALEPPPVNLVPNPDPSRYQDNGTSPDLITDVSQTGWWTTAPESGTASVYVSNGSHLAGHESAYVINGQSANSPESYRVYCRPEGTSAIPVTAGHSYTAGVYVYSGGYPDVTATVGVAWFDASGEITDPEVTESSALTVAEDSVTWVDTWGDPETCYNTHPTATFTAPAGAAFAAPYTHIETNNGPYGVQIRVSGFTLYA